MEEGVGLQCQRKRGFKRRSKQKVKISRVHASRKRKSVGFKHKGLGFKATQSRKLAERYTPVRSRSNFPFLFLQLRRFFSKNRHKFYKT